MRRIDGTTYSSLSAYFGGIDDPTAWTAESPAVYSEVVWDGTLQVRLVASTGRRAFLAAMLEGGVTYRFSSTSSVPVGICCLRYFSSTRSSRAFPSGLDRDGFGALDGFAGAGFAGAGGKFRFTPEFRDVFLIIFCIPSGDRDYLAMRELGGRSDMRGYYSYYSWSSLQYEIGGSVSVSISPEPLHFDWSPCMRRDWQKRIGGLSWNVNGKVNAFRRLDERRSQDT